MLSDGHRILHNIFVLVWGDIFIHAQITQELWRVNVIVLKRLTLEQDLTSCRGALHTNRAVWGNRAGRDTGSTTVQNSARGCSRVHRSTSVVNVLSHVLIASFTTIFVIIYYCSMAVMTNLRCWCTTTTITFHVSINTIIFVFIISKSNGSTSNFRFTHWFLRNKWLICALLSLLYACMTCTFTLCTCLHWYFVWSCLYWQHSW